MELAVTLDGLEKIFDTLTQAEKKVLKKAANKAGAAAGKVLAREAKAQVRAHQGILNATRKRTGALAKAVDSKAKFYESSGITAVVVGPKRGTQIDTGRVRTRGKRKGKPVTHWPTLIAHLVEKGVPGHAKAFPFLQPALEIAGKQAEEAAAEAAQKVLTEV